MIEPLTGSHASIFPHLREADITEAMKWSSFPLDLRLYYTISTADMGYAFMYNGRVEAICGVGMKNDPWLLATDELEKHPVLFYRTSKKIIDKMKNRYEWLANYVDADNTLSVRWLEWAGFIIDAPDDIGFRRFHWKRGEQSCVRQ